MVASRHRRSGGYIVAILSISLALITIAYLSLAAHSSEVEDRVQEQRTETAAYYAAESGIVLAQHKVKSIAAKAPPQGDWLTGELPTAGTKFKVEVLSENYAPEGFTVRSTGRVPEETGEQTFEARFELVKGQGFQVVWRGKP